MTEKQLIDGCKRCDAKAQRQLYETFAAKMLGVCYRYVNDRETARDLMHDGFITLYSKIGDFRGEGSFEGWIRRIFVNTALGYIRKNSKFAETRQVEDVYDLSSDDISAYERLTTKDLMNTIGKMPEGYRTVLNLYAIEGYSHAEIGEMLNISENTSRSQYSRARAQLATLLKKTDQV